ncbi:formyltetrahydrofolate deformylase [Mariniblastus fucicola]|uniref:Formyltetrahydrofolate deformylase n=1 Tax=Mariniblastus fucicola TaxID=980251 RepID=A0A5B9PGZ4_9BACT|nr:formyltetrahydrofolate deformylase [Mariniblastus fucicola]QEG23876.1 Formyltetrahydrofolate deformylase [Mariniblastus fucicola]
MLRSACLLFQCNDRVGIIAELVTFFRDSNVSISRFEEYTDNQYFFARLEWKGDHPWDDASDFEAAFSGVADSFESASFRVHFFDKPQKLGLFSSKEPHTLIEAINRCEAGEYPNTEICFLISNSAEIQRYAQRHDIPFHFVKTWKDPKRHEPAQMELIQQHKPDLIGLARYMKILSAEFIENAGCPIVNIHHSFLPSFIGAKPYELAYERGVKLIGATSHYVIPELDQGPIIEQDVIRVEPGDSVDHMKKIGRDVEKRVFATALEKALWHKTITYDNKTIVFN